jgi:hypothetical protein
MKQIKEFTDPKNIQDDKVKDLFVDSEKKPESKKKKNKGDNHEELVAKKTRQYMQISNAVNENEENTVDTKQILSRMIDNLVAGNKDAVKADFAAYVQPLGKDILSNKISAKIVESFNLIGKRLHENVGTEQEITMSQGGAVFVKGKKIGIVKAIEDSKNVNGVAVYGEEDFERNGMEGIQFISIDGSFSKEFETLEQLYAFISDRYGVR